MPSALEGLRIIEACEGVGGPFAAMLLAEQGADVIKVEPPRGDRLRGQPAFHALNRSKRGVTLDLDSEDGRAKLRNLLAGADAFVYDWAPAIDAPRGFTPGAMRAINPRLVVGYLPAYGSRGRWKDLPADEALMQAVAGLCEAQYRYDPQPVFINIPIAGYAQAIVAAVAMASSLYARARGAAADRFEVSGAGATFAFETVAYMLGSGTVWRSGQQDPRGPIPTYRLVRGSDGGWLFAGALTPPFWASLAVAIGLEECLVDERFASAPMGIANVDDRRELARRVDAAFEAKTSEEWLRILEEADVPRAPVLTREEYARDPQTLHNNMIVEVDDPELGRTRQMNVPVALHNSPGRIKGAAPRLGEHNAILDELTASGSAPAGEANGAMRAHPLEEVVVLDLGTFIAGANASMMLSDLGANVIKIEPPEGGDGWRSSGLAFFGSNRGKRSVCLDLKSPEGRALFLELVARADVVLDNVRAGVMERLGIGWEELRKRNPRIIHCSVTGYGPSGPYAHLPGFDPLMQARSGVMRAQGEAGGEPVFLQVPVCDYMTALSAAYGVVCALVARERTGHGDRVETSLANSAFTVQAGEFIFYDGKPSDPPGGRDLAGRHALYRVYPAGDGYLMLACSTQGHADALLGALGIDATPDALGAPLHGDLARTIEERLRMRDIASWLDALLPLGIPVAPCTRFNDVFEDEHLVENGLWWDFEHPKWGKIRQTGAVVQWDGMAMHLPRRAPLLGEHTIECLRELAVDGARLDDLMRSGVVRQAEEAASAAP